MGVCLDQSGVSQRRHSDEAISESHAAPSVFPGKWPGSLLMSPRRQGSVLNERRHLCISTFK